jgi:hypothetical protein
MVRGLMNEKILQHGGTASYSMIGDCSWTGSSEICCSWAYLTTHAATTSEPWTIGEASTYASARVSLLYSRDQASQIYYYNSTADQSCQFVLFGDPNVQFVQTNWEVPEPASTTYNYGGHYPG